MVELENKTNFYLLYGDIRNHTIKETLGHLLVVSKRLLTMKEILCSFFANLDTGMGFGILLRFQNLVNSSKNSGIFKY